MQWPPAATEPEATALQREHAKAAPARPLSRTSRPTRVGALARAASAPASPGKGRQHLLHRLPT
eukprot:scaffold76430_cov64-Phaeocystis_antarctica.AAC.4